MGYDLTNLDNPRLEIRFSVHSWYAMFDIANPYSEYRFDFPEDIIGHQHTLANALEKALDSGERLTVPSSFENAQEWRTHLRKFIEFCRMGDFKMV